MSMNLKPPSRPPLKGDAFPADILNVRPKLLPLEGEAGRGHVENIGVEPMTSCVQGRRSSQLS